jgi:hypothetical protein
MSIIDADKIKKASREFDPATTIGESLLTECCQEG